MTSHQIHKFMAAVARRRPVFHSEADCQHELALEIHQAGHQVRLEVPRDVQVNGATGYAVFLTNAPSAWRDDVSATANMARDFSIHEGRRLPRGRPLDWDPPTPPVA